MTPWLIIGGMIVLTLGATIKRMRDGHGITALAWLVMLAAAGSPLTMAKFVLEPGEPLQSATIAKLHDKATLDVPAGYSIMATAQFRDPLPEDSKGKTDYSMAIKGDGWSQQASATAHVKSTSGPEIDVKDGAGISERTRTKSKLGEDMQERFDLEGSGPLTVEVTLWNGDAAQMIHLDVVKAPPPEWIFWLWTGVITVLGLVVEIKDRSDKFAGDVIFVAAIGAFLHQGVTPLDSLQSTLWAMVAAMLVGWGLGAGLAYVIIKLGFGEPRKKAAKVAEGDGGTPA